MTNDEIARNLLADRGCDTCRVKTQNIDNNKIYFCFNPEMMKRLTCEHWRK